MSTVYARTAPKNMPAVMRSFFGSIFTTRRSWASCGRAVASIVSNLSSRGDELDAGGRPWGDFIPNYHKVLHLTQFDMDVGQLNVISDSRLTVLLHSWLCLTSHPEHVPVFSVALNLSLHSASAVISSSRRLRFNRREADIFCQRFHCKVGSNGRWQNTHFSPSGAYTAAIQGYCVLLRLIL